MTAVIASTSRPATSRQFPSISIALEAAQAQYAMEDARHDGIQQKAATSMGTAGIIVSVLGIRATFSDPQTFALLATFLISVFSGIVVLATSRFRIPGRDINDFFALAALPNVVALDELLLANIEAVKQNRRRNNGKLWFLRVSIGALLAGVIELSIFLVLPSVG